MPPFARPATQQPMFKRLYWFIIKSFLPLFAMTFFIVLFIVLMQFLWRYIDDLVGKGLSMGVLGELFFYAAVSMVPMALPLAILLASLMTFGNLGERSELTAIKAAGVSLVKTMRPLIIFISLIAVGAFFFQNNVLPVAQVKMWTLLFSAKQKSPELEIPEGVFYDRIPGYNLYVKSKNGSTGMLRDVMIYDVSKGGDNSTILMADSARLAFTDDMRYLYLHLFNGEQFENLREQRNMDRNVPFRRESFLDKEVLIPFDANFNRLDEGGVNSQYVGKNMSQLRVAIDSLSRRVDSIGTANTAGFRNLAFPGLYPNGGYHRSAPDAPGVGGEACGAGG
ncbi:MAG: LptF/LptG family permease, partial [Candidatus Amulumruptor caecigallinarius]|nr:LptF/LptG family permease [Candidatus Amulumruptor caecigallinarius]